MDCKPVVVVVGYNRTESLLRLLNSLEQAEYPPDVTLIVSIDFGGDENVGIIADEFEWTHGKKIVRKYAEKQGLRKHVVSCIDYSMEYGSAIVFEDDIFASPYYYLFAQAALRFYSNDEKVLAIALYSHTCNYFANRSFCPFLGGKDVYVSKKNSSWGECIIGTQWKEFKKWHKEYGDELKPGLNIPEPIYSWNDSWCKYINAYLSMHDKWIVTPYESYATNFNEIGKHMLNRSNVFQLPLVMGKREWAFDSLKNLPAYDLFMENVYLQELLGKRYSKSVCIDFYGTKTNRTDYELCLSSAILPFEIYDSYSLDMRPYELNVLYNFKGKGIYIYDMKRKVKHRKDRDQHYRIVRYEVKNLSFVDALFYSIYSLLRKK